MLSTAEAGALVWLLHLVWPPTILLADEGHVGGASTVVPIPTCRLAVDADAAFVPYAYTTLSAMRVVGLIDEPLRVAPSSTVVPCPSSRTGV
jgi:hypothetical protein